MSETQDGTTIFTDNNASTTTTGATPASTTTEQVLPDELKEFVGEGKKYATVTDALKSVPHAQNYIEEQKRLLAEATRKAEELAKELQSRKSVEELLTDIKGGNTQQTTTATVDTSLVSTIVSSELKKLEDAKITKANLLEADKQMKAAYGDKAKEVFAIRAAELNLSTEHLMQIAASSPKAFLTMLGVNPKQHDTSTKQSSSINTDSLLVNGKQENSAKVKMVGASTSDLVSAWRNAAPVNE